MKLKYFALALLIASACGLSQTLIHAQSELSDDYEEPFYDNEPFYEDGGIVGGAVEGAGEVVSDIGRAIGGVI